MPFCPKCKAEYVPEILMCSDCGMPLVTELTPDSSAHSDPDPKGDFVALRGAYPNRIHAEMVAEALENAGIPRMVKSNEMFGTGTGLGSLAPTRVQIWVPADKLGEAQSIADGTIDSI